LFVLLQDLGGPLISGATESNPPWCSRRRNTPPFPQLLTTVAANHGVATVLADATDDNLPSQCEHLPTQGSPLFGADADLQYYEIRPPEPST